MLFFNPLEQFLLIQNESNFLLELLKGFRLPSFLLINELSANIYLSLINLQYYKLSFFLILLLTAFSVYKSNIFPKNIWQYINQQSHIIAQSVLKPTFGSHYPFEVRFYNYYPFLYHIFLFILCNNLLGLVPYGFSNSAYIVHNFTLSFLLLSGLTLIVFLFKEFIIINYLFQKTYQLT